MPSVYLRNVRFSPRLRMPVGVVGFAVILMGFLQVPCLAQTSKQTDRPNILFIFSDDHAQRSIGAYGSGLNETPNIDIIANEGAVFTRSYCANSICSPSRASILTGKHSHKNGVYGHRPNSKWDSQQFVFSRDLKKAGYRTALIGKWHQRGLPDDAFDYWNILSGAGGQGHYYNPDFLGKEGETRQVQGYSTDIITDQAIQWLDEQRQTHPDKPFLMMAQFKAPHIHRIPPPRHMDKYDGQTLPEPETMYDDYANRSPYASKTWMRFAGMQDHILNIVPRGGYDTSQKQFKFLARMSETQRRAYHEAYDPDNDEYRRMRAAGLIPDDSIELMRYKYQRFVKDYLGCVAAIDDNVGRLLQWLVDNGLSENTVVIYASDQGFYLGEHGWNDKRFMYEESLSMPFIMRWPGQISPGTRIDAMIQNIDYAPTFLEIAGVDIPADVQGRSLLPILAGQTPDDWRKSIYYHYYDDGSYNLPRFEGVRTERYKLINYYYPQQAWELFDLQEDRLELRSVYDDPAHAEVLEKMMAELSRQRQNYNLPPLNR